MYFAIIEERNLNAAAEWSWRYRSARIGGYKSLKRAINAILNHHANGTVQNSDRTTAALVQNGRVTYPR
jgi:hypothetical protein